MNLSLGFFHGEQALVGLIFAAVLVLLGFPLLVYVWLRHTKISEQKLALAYFIVAAGACGVFALSVPGPASIPILIVCYIAFILTLPWNLITAFALHLADGVYMSDHEVALVMLMGAGINTMLLYFLGKKMRERFTI